MKNVISSFGNNIIVPYLYTLPYNITQRLHLIIYLKDKTTQKYAREYSEWLYSYSKNFKPSIPSICEWLK